MTHHIVEHSAPLKFPFPEPRLVRAAVLFCGSSQIGTAGNRCSSCPDDLFSPDPGRSKDLVFAVAGQKAGLLDQLQHPFGLLDIPSQGFLAGDAEKLSFAGLHSLNDLFHIFQPAKVRSTNPDSIYGRISDHLGQGFIDFCFSHVEFSG